MGKINLSNLSFKEVDEARQTKLVVIKKIRGNRNRVKMKSFPLDELKLIKAIDFLGKIKDDFK